MPTAIPLPILPPSDAEQKAVAEQENRFDPERVTANVAAIVRDAEELKKKLSPVEEVEASMEQWKDLQERIEANERELARLKSLRDAQTV
jgi:hypothetical protein